MTERRGGKPQRDRIDEIADGYAQTDATVIELLRKGQWTLRLMVVLVVLGICSSAYFYRENHQRQDAQRALSASNRALAVRANTAAAQAKAAAAKATKGVETACALLVRFAQQAGAGTSRTGASKASRLNRELTVAVVDQVLRLSPPEVRARITGLYHRIRRAGAIIRFPDCEQVARDPQSVTQVGPSSRQKGSTRP